MEKKQLLLERLLECDANFNDIISYIEEKIANLVVVAITAVIVKVSERNNRKTGNLQLY